jgi:hypothetical protein
MRVFHWQIYTVLFFAFWMILPLHQLMITAIVPAKFFLARAGVHGGKYDGFL